MSKRIVKYFISFSLLIICLATSEKSFGQVILSDNFDDGSLVNTPSSVTNPVWSTNAATSGPFTIDATNPMFGTTNSLKSHTLNVPSHTYTQYLTNTTLSANGNLTWRVLYKNTVNNDNANINTVTAGNNIWKLWLAADNIDPTVSNGYYLTQKAGTLYLMQVKPNGGSTFDTNKAYTTIASCTLTNTTLYSIKVVRSTSGVGGNTLWTLYCTGGTTGDPTNSFAGNSLNEVLTTNGNIYTMFESNDVNAAGRFEWDDYTIAESQLTFGCNPTTFPSTTLFAGDTNKPVFGFELSYIESIPIKSIVISIGGLALNNSQLSTFKLIMSTNAVFGDGDDTDITSNFTTANNGSNITFNATSYNLAGTATATTKYFYLVLSISSTYVNTSGISNGAMSSTTPSITYAANNIVSTPAYSCTGGNFSIGKNYDWSGNADLISGSPDLNWATGKNWLIGGSGIPGAGPGQYDNARIGVVAYTQSTHQPKISATTTTTSGLTFGTNNSPALTINSGSTLVLNAGLTVNASSTAAILSTGSISLPTGSVSTINSTGTLSIAPSVTNAGAITSAGALTISGAVTNSGSITLGTLATTFSGNLTNSGTITAGSGAFTILNTGMVTLNSGTVTLGSGTFTTSGGLDIYGGILQAGSGDFINNHYTRLNAGTEIVNFGSGTTSLKNGLTVNGGTVNFGTGPATITPSFSMSPTTGGTVNCSTGSVTIANGFTLSSGVFNAGSGSATLNISGPFTNAHIYAPTNPGTFNPGTGTVTFNGSYTNSSIFNYSTGTIIFNNPTVGTAQAIADNSTGGTTFNNVTFTGPVATTASAINMSGSGKFVVASTGKLTLGNATTLVTTGGILTLKSDGSGTASVATIPSGSSITGNVNVERYLTGGQSYSRGYRLLSSPVSVSSGSLILPNLTYVANAAYTTGTTGTGGGFAGTGNPTIYLYRENLAPSNASFTSGNFRGLNIINNSTLSSFNLDGETGSFNIPAGNGVMFFFRGDKATTNNPTTTSTVAKATTMSVTGYLNQGPITVTHWTGTPSPGKLLYTSTGGSAIQGFNLVGNPYASSIDWDLVSAANADPTTGVLDKIWIYNPTLKTYATYIAGTNGVGANFNGPSGTADIIPSGQGFFVKANSASSVLTFTEADKSTAQVSSSTISLATSSTDLTTAPKYMRIELFKDSLNREEALMFFKSTAKSAFVSAEDAEYLKGNSLVNLSTRSSDNIALAINQMALPQQSQTIPLNVNITSNGIYKLNLTEIKNIPQQFDVWLMDSYKKDSLDIKNNPTYSFNANTADTSSYGTKRFSLIIRQNATLLVHLLSFNAVKAATKVNLTWTAENEANYTHYTLERSTDGGKTYVVLDSLTSASLGTYNDIDPNPGKGLNQYRLKQVDVAGNVSYSSTINIMYAVTSNNIANNLLSVYPNPVRSTLNLAISPTSATSTTYKITITNTIGTVVKSTTSNDVNWQADMSNLPPGNYFIEVINTKDNTVTGKNTFIKL